MIPRQHYVIVKALSCVYVENIEGGVCQEIHTVCFLRLLSAVFFVHTSIGGALIII